VFDIHTGSSARAAPKTWCPSHGVQFETKAGRAERRFWTFSRRSSERCPVTALGRLRPSSPGDVPTSISYIFTGSGPTAKTIELFEARVRGLLLQAADGAVDAEVAAGGPRQGARAYQGAVAAAPAGARESERLNVGVMKEPGRRHHHLSRALYSDPIESGLLSSAWS
jgi:hypothetical protein